MVLAAFLVGGAAAGWVLGDIAIQPVDRYLTIRAREYAYDPPVIRINRGDRLHLKLVSQDVVHGFYLEGYDLDAVIYPQQNKVKVRHPSEGETWKEQDEIVVVASKPGKYRYRCSHTCGSFHPFMNGELIVAPNHLFHAGLGACAGLFAGFVLLASRERQNGQAGANS